MRTGLILLLCLLTFPVFADEVLWEKLQKNSNMVILMRHTQSSGGNALVWDASGNCRGESTLTRNGKSHAKKIGEAFTNHGIKPMVISSPMCRCRESSQIAFGEYVTDPDLRETASADAQQQEMFQAKAGTMLAKYRGKTPIAFVSHRPNIDSLTMELIDDGDLLVGSISETGEIKIVGKIRMEP
jgi:phosphohistidine phosphatase SixA